MFAALFRDGPVRSLLYASFGFASIAFITALPPLMMLAYLARLPAIAPHAHGEHATFSTMMKSAWLPDRSIFGQGGSSPGSIERLLPSKATALTSERSRNNLRKSSKKQTVAH